jgi:hypothetical protein
MFLCPVYELLVLLIRFAVGVTNERERESSQVSMVCVRRMSRNLSNVLNVVEPAEHANVSNPSNVSLLGDPVSLFIAQGKSRLHLREETKKEKKKVKGSTRRERTRRSRVVLLLLHKSPRYCRYADDATHCIWLCPSLWRRTGTVRLGHITRHRRRERCGQTADNDAGRTGLR